MALTKKDLLEAIEDMPKWKKVTEENYKIISEIDCGLYPIMFARKTQIGGKRTPRQNICIEKFYKRIGGHQWKKIEELRHSMNVEFLSSLNSPASVNYQN